MNEAQQALLLELQQLGLTMDDLREYLDTHPYDDFAIERFSQTAQMYTEKQQEWGKLYGPLTQRCPAADHNIWQWAMNDFPWDH